MRPEPSLSFGVAADVYDRARPDWPEELLDVVPLGNGATVLDVGAGTGKLTRLLVQRFARVIALEPDDAMRALIDVGEPLVGTAEAIPLADSCVRGIFSAEAFHWFDGTRALAEFARVLTPGGVLALLWNRYNPADYVIPDGALPESTSPKHGSFVSGAWRNVLEGAPFGPLREVAVPQERDVSRSELLDYFASVSPVTSLRHEARTEALARIAAALDRPVYRRRWTAELYWTRLGG